MFSLGGGKWDAVLVVMALGLVGKKMIFYRPLVLTVDFNELRVLYIHVNAFGTLKGFPNIHRNAY